MLRVHVQDETIHVLDKRFRKVGANILKLLLELGECFGLVVEGDDELCERLVIDAWAEMC